MYVLPQLKPYKRSELNMKINKIAIVLDETLETWKKLNACAFLTSGLAAHEMDNLIGDPYFDASRRKYLPIFNQPVLVYACDSVKLKTVLQRTYNRDVRSTIYIADMFSTSNDEDNRATVTQYESEDLPVIGLGVFGLSKEVDKVLRGVKLHP